MSKIFRMTRASVATIDHHCSGLVRALEQAQRFTETPFVKRSDVYIDCTISRSFSTS